jgi:hypothetical protein
VTDESSIVRRGCEMLPGGIYICFAVSEEASRVNFGYPLLYSFAPLSQGDPCSHLYEESYTYSAGLAKAGLSAYA